MIRTAACEVLRIVHPVAQAGMSRYGTNAALVAAVSEAGGLGILGCLGRPLDETIAEIARIRTLTARPFGVNFVTHLLDEDVFAACLAARVPVFNFFRGTPAAAIGRAHEAGATVLYQVTTVEEARQALDAGADALIAQGHEAGGHNGPVPLWSLLPDVVALAGAAPVLAAGGIVDGQGLAAALCLGASGVLMGTRFLATFECPATPRHKQAILDAEPGDTVASGVPDLLWAEQWPGVQVRALRNALIDRWHGREDRLLAAWAEASARLLAAEAEDDAEETLLLAGMGASRIRELLPAGEVVRRVAAEAEQVLRAACNR